MAGDEISRSEINFAQAEGAEALPKQLALREVSQELRALVWPIIWSPLDQMGQKAAIQYEYASIRDPWHSILLRWHIHGLNRFADEFDSRVIAQIGLAKTIVANGSYTEFFKFIEFIVRDRDAPPGTGRRFNHALESACAAYRIIDQNVVPVASEEDAKAVTKAFEALRSGKFPGARSHLAEAGRELSAGNWASSVRESIHAVESAARVLVPGTSTLAPALLALDKVGKIHPAMKIGFSNLYGFTSDEQGIRHALLDKGDAAVTEADGLYMFGACAAFLTYLSLREQISR